MLYIDNYKHFKENIIKPIYNVKCVKERFNNEEQLTFSFFYGGYYSQWFPSKIRINDIDYCNAEQYMMAQKALFFKDIDIFNKIMDIENPKKIKALGKKVKNFDQEAWDQIKYHIVFNGNYNKFSQNKKLKEYLLKDNNDIIVEASPYDRIWGIGLDEFNKNCNDPNKWRGQNLLGFSIMHVRDILRWTYNKMIKLSIDKTEELKNNNSITLTYPIYFCDPNHKNTLYIGLFDNSSGLFYGTSKSIINKDIDCESFEYRTTFNVPEYNFFEVMCFSDEEDIDKFNKYKFFLNGDFILTTKNTKDNCFEVVIEKV